MEDSRRKKRVSIRLMATDLLIGGRMINQVKPVVHHVEVAAVVPWDELIGNKWTRKHAGDKINGAAQQ